MSLPEKEYPKYLKQAFQLKLMKKLDLKHPKTLNEKIQWLKIYDNIPIKTKLTDKVLVRDYVENKIGSQYLKPVLWKGKSFDDIPFPNLPNRFVIKANHGCSWNIFVKNKEEFIQHKQIYECCKKQIEGWMSQSYFGWSDFETQYRDIIPQIIIEDYLNEDSKTSVKEIEIWCFNSIPLIFEKHYVDFISKERIVNIYDNQYNNIDLKFIQNSIIKKEEADDILKKAVELSKVLAKDFKLVRIDWLIYKNNLYFGEMTFTPQSGYFLFSDKQNNWDIKLGKMLKLKGK